MVSNSPDSSSIERCSRTSPCINPNRLRRSWARPRMRSKVNSEIRRRKFSERNRPVKHKTNLLMLTLTFLVGSIIAFAQTTPPTGTYEAMVKIPSRGEEKVTLELKNEGGNITGRVTHGPKTADSTEAKLENGTLTLNFGEGRIIVAKVDGDKLVGEATDGKEKIPVEFKKVTPAAAAAPATPSAAAPVAPATPSAAA